MYNVCMKAKLQHIYDKTHWFSDADAWMLFRLAAIVEAVGWTLLISAIVSRRLGMPGADIAVSMAGTVHGVFFLVFFVILLVTARSMEWGPWRLGSGLIAGNIPYASIAFERLMTWHRRKFPPRVPAPAGYDAD